MSEDLDYDQLISDCEKRESKMSDWEREFIDSVATRLRRGDSLTIRQCQIIEQIWEKIT
jgi:hypothetical protein